MAQEFSPEPVKMPEKAAPPGKMTYEEFLAWADEDTWAEWVNGEVVILSPASLRHQQLATFLSTSINFFVDAHKLGVVLTPPFQMKTGSDLPGREPDIIFVAREHLDRFRDTYLNGPADLVVEIISRDSRARDRGDKFYEYEQGGVREYWLLDYLRRQAEFHQLGPDGIYRPVPVGADGIYHSAVLEGLWLRVEWLWQEPLPPLMNMLREWRLV
jgi:Uma2 family endonuclease